MNSITESAAAVIAAPRTPRYRSRFTPVTEPWQRATDRIGYQPRHANPTRASHCSCGRPARQLLDGGRFGPTGFCGAPFPPLHPCDCGEGAERHSRNVCHIYGRGMAETVVAR